MTTRRMSNKIKTLIKQLNFRQTYSVDRGDRTQAEILSPLSDFEIHQATDEIFEEFRTIIRTWTDLWAEEMKRGKALSDECDREEGEEMARQELTSMPSSTRIQ